MGGGNAAFRLEIGATGYMLNDYDWGSARTFTVDRRSGTGWREVARFHEHRRTWPLTCGFARRRR